MTGLALVRPVSAAAWELRRAWATGRRVSVTLERADVERMEGIVTKVAATDAFATIRGHRVPLDRVLAVHWPSRLGDGDGGGRGARRDLGRPGQLEIR